MKFWTLDEIKLRIRTELDLEEETFIENTELGDYINDAIDDAESEIHNLYEDYYIKHSKITLVADQYDYDVPADLYGDKIRGIFYKNGTRIYKVKRMRDWTKFMEFLDRSLDSTSTDEYKWFMMNESADGRKIWFAPTPKEAGEYIWLFYIRNANRLTTGTDKCDIPESIQYILAYTKMKVNAKENGGVPLQEDMTMVEAEMTKMVGRLATRIPDAENEIEPDLSHYYDMAYNL